MPKYIPLAFEIKLRPEGLVFDVGSLFEAFCGLHDQRDARGLRYPLVTVLVYVLLAKLGGQDQVHGIAQWVRRWAGLLADFFGLAKAPAPHETTYSRILGKAFQLGEFEQVLRDFFARQPQAGQSVHIALDGKTLRGTIPAAARLLKTLDLRGKIITGSATGIAARALADREWVTLSAG
jgi:hypothetical protein